MNPHPYFEDRWNQALIGLCVANVVALLMLLALPEGSLDLRRVLEPSWVTSPAGIGALFLFWGCVVGTIILWINMWMYWTRAGRPLGWLFPLLLGPWGPAIAFHFMVYRKDLEAFKRHDEEERRDLTHF